MPFGNETCKEKRSCICPHCKEVLYVNPRTFANHVRHCSHNPEHNSILESTRKALQEAAKKKALEKKGPIREFYVKCSHCGKEFSVFEEEKLFPKKNRYFCCRSCANSRVRSKETKELIRRSLQRTLLDKGIENPFEDRKCPICGKTFKARKAAPKSQVCSKKCAGYLRSRKACQNKDLFLRYRKCCQFHFSLKDVTEIEGHELLREFGMYKAANRGNNLKGVSRDHRLSIKEGFKQNIDPYYISHPANCQLIQQQDNASKGCKSCVSFTELKATIDRWNNEKGYFENKIDYKLLPEMKF